MRSHRRCAKRLEPRRELTGQAADYVLHAVLKVDGHPPIVCTIEDEALAMENQILGAYLKRYEITLTVRFGL